MITQNTIDRILSEVSIAAVLDNGTNINFRKNMLCPVHDEKSPSFKIYPESERFHCFGCGKNGNVINLVMETDGLTFVEAVKFIANRHGIPIEYEAENHVDPAIREKRRQMSELLCKVNRLFSAKITDPEITNYLEKRCISKEIAAYFNLGYSPNDSAWLGNQLTETETELAVELGILKKSKHGFIDVFQGRLIIPQFDTTGTLVGFSGRVTNESDMPKYLNSSESELFHKGQILFGWPLAWKSIRNSDSVIIVEGYMDVIAAFANGLTNVVAVAGSGLTENQMQKLKSSKVKRIRLLFDTDSAGQNGMITAIRNLAKFDLIPDIIEMPSSYKDLDEYLQKEGIDNFENLPLVDGSNKLIDSLFSEEINSNERDFAYVEFSSYLMSIPSDVKREIILSAAKKNKRIENKALEIALAKMQKAKSNETKMSKAEKSLDATVYDLPYDGESFLQCTRKKSNIPDVRQSGLISLTEYLGFRRPVNGNIDEFMYVKDNIVSIVDNRAIQTAIFEYVSSLPDKFWHQDSEYDRSVLIELLTRSNTMLFNISKLSLLAELSIKDFRDEADSMKFFYRNGVLVVKMNSLELIPYENYNELVLESQILQRDFPIRFIMDQHTENTIPDGQFGDFLFFVAGQDIDQIMSLRSIIGFLMHQYFPGGEKAIIFTDGGTASEPNGRTGKGIIGKGLSYMRNVAAIPGKSFDTKSHFKYQRVKKSTHIIHLEDIKARFNFEDLFNEITDQIEVQQKHKNPFSIRSKFMISTNRTVDLAGTSSTGRAVEFEMSNYFGLHRTPLQVFGGYLFEDWKGDKAIEWEYFDMYMVTSAQIYLRHSLCLPKYHDLQDRKFLDVVGQEFYDWALSKNFQTGIKYIQKEYQQDFMNLIISKPWTSQQFTKALAYFAKYKNWKFDHKPSNSVVSFWFERIIEK